MAADRRPGFQEHRAMASTRTTRADAAVPVRDATPAEHDAVRDVIVAAYREYGAVLPPPLFERYLADVADVDARARAGALIVAEHAGRIVGAVTFYERAGAEGFAWPPGWAGLRALGVLPEARGLGVARALMAECLRRARAASAPVLCLHTAALMTTAVAMYEAMGFRRVPEYDFEAGGSVDLEDGGPDGAPVRKPVMVIAYRLDL
jgi:ribosomal protein S18 acetylase RimI-like enzyme